MEFNPNAASAPPPITSAEDLFAPKKKKSWSLGGVLLFLLTLLVAGYAGQLWFTRSEFQSQITSTQNSIAQIKTAIQNLQSKENISDQLAAADILKKAEERRVQWSSMVTEVAAFQTEDIAFSNYSTNKDNQIFVTGRAPSYASVAQLIETIRGSRLAEAEFVESVVLSKNNAASRSARPGAVTKSAESAVQFQLVFDYTPES